MPISLEDAREYAGRSNLEVTAVAGPYADNPASHAEPHEWLISHRVTGRLLAEYHAAEESPATKCKAGRFFRFAGRSHYVRSFRQGLRLLLRYLRACV